MYQQDIIYYYDGSFEGLLTAVFRYYEEKTLPLDIVSPERQGARLFAINRQITSQPALAERVIKGLESKTSIKAVRALYRAFLSERRGIEMVILRYIRYAMSSPQNIEEDYSHPDVLSISQINKQIRREVHRMHAFVRFQKTEDELYYAAIEPDFDVIPLIGGHFEERFADQKWLIYDTKRKKGLFYDLACTQEITLENQQTHHLTQDVLPEIRNQQEPLYRLLWQQYFQSVDIQERKNLRLHIKHVPRRYWKYLSEKQPMAPIPDDLLTNLPSAKTQFSEKR